MGPGLDSWLLRPGGLQPPSHPLNKSHANAAQPGGHNKTKADHHTLTLVCLTHRACSLGQSGGQKVPRPILIDNSWHGSVVSYIKCDTNIPRIRFTCSKHWTTPGYGGDSSLLSVCHMVAWSHLPPKNPLLNNSIA